MVITSVENVLTKKSVFLCGLRNLFKNFQLFIYLFIYWLYTNNGKQLRGCKKSWREKNQVPSDIVLYNDYIILLLHICITCTIGCAENIEICTLMTRIYGQTTTAISSKRIYMYIMLNAIANIQC